MFYEKELQKPNQTEFRIEKVKKREKLINCKWKVVIIHLIVGLIKKILLYQTSYFPEPCSYSKNKINKLN